jgi:hypothetical protein
MNEYILNGSKLLIVKRAKEKFTQLQLEQRNDEGYQQLKATEKMYKQQINGDELIVCLFCPITGEEINTPTRSIHCRHYDCVDFDNFLYSLVEYR